MIMAFSPFRFRCALGASRWPQERSKRPQGGTKSILGNLKTAPRALQEASRRLQERSGRPQGGSKMPQDSPKGAPFSFSFHSTLRPLVHAISTIRYGLCGDSLSTSKRGLLRALKYAPLSRLASLEQGGGTT